MRERELATTPTQSEGVIDGMFAGCGAGVHAADTLALGAERGLAWLRRELRRERARGRCGHWTYNLARHLSLLRDVRRAEDARRKSTVATGCGTGTNGHTARPPRHRGCLTLGAFAARV